MSEHTDYLDELAKIILAKLTENHDLGYYLVILRKDGLTESTMGSHPGLTKQHFYEHIIPTLADDLH
jgi:hypothetical protein